MSPPGAEAFKVAVWPQLMVTLFDDGATHCALAVNSEDPTRNVTIDFERLESERSKVVMVKNLGRLNL
jgi:hypothetical protein